MSNFKSIGLVISDILGLSCFIILAWNFYFGDKIWHFWGKYGSNVEIKYYNPKRHIVARFRAFWAIMRQNQSKGLISARASDKNKVTRKWHFTYFPRSSPWTDFYQTWTERSPMDLINCDKFCDNLFNGLSFTGGQISQFSHRNLRIWRRRYNSATQWPRNWHSGIIVWLNDHRLRCDTRQPTTAPCKYFFGWSNVWLNQVVYRTTWIEPSSGLLCPRPPPSRRGIRRRCASDVCLSVWRLSRASGLSPEQRGLWRLKLAQR